MKRCKVCGRYGRSHLHVLRRIMRILGIKAIFKIQRTKQKKDKPAQIEQQPINNLPLFQEEKHV